MSGAIDLLNRATEIEAQSAFRHCCGSSRWVAAMIVARPFRDMGHLREAAARAFSTLTREDLYEAFSHHPRIGERKGLDRTSSAEQAGALSADEAMKRALTLANRDYEAKFGHVYLVCATGKSAQELLAILRGRMGNDKATELRVAAAELEKIACLRLEKLA